MEPFSEEDLKSAEKGQVLQLEASYLISQSTGDIAGFSLTHFSLGMSVLAQSTPAAAWHCALTLAILAALGPTKM